MTSVKKSKLSRNISNHLRKRRPGVTNMAALGIVLILVIALFAFAYIYITPGSVTPGGPKTTSTNQTGTGVQTGAPCSTPPIQSELTSSNGQVVTSPKVATYQELTSGTWTRLASASGTLTQNTLNTASAYTNLPVVQVYSGTNVYNQTVVISSGTQAPTVDPTTGTTVLSVSCAPAASGSNNVNTLQAIATVFTGPASGTSATTNVENVINSQTSQTNSFPAAFPTSAPVTVSSYLQVFSSNTIAGRDVMIPGSTNAPITDFGGLNCNGVNEPATSVLIKSNFACYEPVAVVAFNQTQVGFTGPAGTVPLTVHGVSGAVAFLVPLTCNGQSPATGVSTSNPWVGCSFTFQVQELISTQSHHIDMAVIVVDNTQPGYIEQYFTTPAVTSFPAAANTHGIPSGFSGLVPPTSANAPPSLIEQYSSVIATW